MSRSYQLIDSGDFKKVEQVGPYTLVRQALGAVWTRNPKENSWQQFDAEFVRHSSGQGEWNKRSQLKDWVISIDEIQFLIQLNSFGHIGIFPEQHKNWLLIEKLIRESSNKNFKVLNLFAYTGGASIAAARAGAEVVHVDSSKTTIEWAKKNAELSKVKNDKIRWILEDAKAFVAREKRRGSKYHGVILDPPSFGRGNKKQVWKIETDMVPLLNDIKDIMAPDCQFVFLSSHSPGYTPIALENLLKTICKNGEFRSEEMMISDKYDRILPSGAGSVYIA